MRGSGRAPEAATGNCETGTFDDTLYGECRSPRTKSGTSVLLSVSRNNRGVVMTSSFSRLSHHTCPYTEPQPTLYSYIARPQRQTTQGRHSSAVQPRCRTSLHPREPGATAQRAILLFEELQPCQTRQVGSSSGPAAPTAAHLPRRAQKLESGGAAAGMCGRRSQWWASNTKRFGGAHQHGEHYCDAADLP